MASVWHHASQELRGTHYLLLCCSSIQKEVRFDLVPRAHRHSKQYWGQWPPWFITFVLVFLFVVYFWVL